MPRAAQPCAAAGAAGACGAGCLPQAHRRPAVAAAAVDGVYHTAYAVRHRPRSGQGTPGGAPQGAGARLLQQPAQQARQHRLALRQRLE